MSRVSDAKPESERVASAAARAARGLVALAAAVALAACGGEGGDGGAADAGASDADAAEGEPRVFFVQPREGDSVSSPVHVVFGSENIEVAAVPAEVEEPREGTIHYHLGVDTDCLPPGTAIPTERPWMHFGGGSSEVEVELSPGQHRLTVQGGDDRHVTLEGLCQTLSITVTGGDG